MTETKLARMYEGFIAEGDKKNAKAVAKEIEKYMRLPGVRCYTTQDDGIFLVVTVEESARSIVENVGGSASPFKQCRDAEKTRFEIRLVPGIVDIVRPIAYEQAA